MTNRLNIFAAVWCAFFMGQAANAGEPVFATVQALLVIINLYWAGFFKDSVRTTLSET